MATERTVLVVEDDPSIALLLQELLGQAGYRAIVRHDVAAVQAAIDDPPALVLLDVILPGIDGLELFRRLKAAPRTRAVPVLFLSALSADMLAELLDAQLRGYPYDGIIHKPFDPDELLAAVRRLVPPARNGDPAPA